VVAELAPRGHDLGEPLDRLVSLRRARRHGGDEQRYHGRVEPVVLGQNTARLGGLTKLERIDLAHRHAGGQQRAHDAALVPTARLDAACRDAQATQPRDELPQPAASLAADQHNSSGNTITSKRSLATSMPQKGTLCHLRIPPC